MVLLLLRCALVLIPALAPQTDETGADWRVEVTALLDSGESDRAIALLEEHLREYGDDADAWRAMAGALARLVDAEGRSWEILYDVRGAWDEVLALDPFDADALSAAVDVRMRLGEYEDAATLALRAIGDAVLREGAAPPELVVTALRARVGAFQQEDGASIEEWMAELERVHAAVATARRARPRDPELARIEAGLLESLLLPDQAARVLARAVEASPAASELHRALVALCLGQGREALLSRTCTGLLARFPQDAVVAWWAGYAERAAGDRAHRERRFEDAAVHYKTCVERVRRSGELEPDYLESARRLEVQARVGRGWCALGAGDHRAAQEFLLAVLREHDDLAGYVDGLGRSALHGLGSVGERWVSLNDFEHAADLARQVTAVVADDATWWNNLGFLLRERATQIESADGDDAKARAREVFGESWRAYLRAAELAPEDARVVNDAALIQIYHLRDELDRAEEMELQAIATGEAQLAALGPDPDERERFPVAQAVGDALENLGYLYYHVHDRPREARRFFEASIATNSGDRSAFQAYFDAIDGEGDPVPERDSGGFVAQPRERDPEPAEIPWEASLDEALAIGRAQGSDVLVYNRGQGLGLAVPVLDRFVRSERFAQIARNYVVVACDATRQTFVDRRGDGRRVDSPRYGAITCGEHVRAWEELRVLWAAQHEGEGPGESAEGLWILRSSSGRLERLERLGRPDGEGGRGDPSPSRLEELASALRGGRHLDRAAAELVGIAGRAARALVEELLFEAGLDEAARTLLVAKLAGRDDEAARELLDALARQTGDAGLARLALTFWPEGAGPHAPRVALAWSTDERVRAAAARALSRAAEPRAAGRELAARLAVEAGGDRAGLGGVLAECLDGLR